MMRPIARLAEQFFRLLIGGRDRRSRHSTTDVRVRAFGYGVVFGALGLRFEVVSADFGMLTRVPGPD